MSEAPKYFTLDDLTLVQLAKLLERQKAQQEDNHLFAWKRYLRRVGYMYRELKYSRKRPAQKSMTNKILRRFRRHGIGALRRATARYSQNKRHIDNTRNAILRKMKTGRG